MASVAVPFEFAVNVTPEGSVPVSDTVGVGDPVVAMGSPYVASSFPQVQTYLCTYSNVTISELSAVKALFGEIPIRGHLPVTIPGTT